MNIEEKLYAIEACKKSLQKEVEIEDDKEVPHFEEKAMGIQTTLILILPLQIKMCPRDPFFWTLLEFLILGILFMTVPYDWFYFISLLNGWLN